eukprot:754518-Hanusia_phi.AAC.2
MLQQLLSGPALLFVLLQATLDEVLELCGEPAPLRYRHVLVDNPLHDLEKRRLLPIAAHVGMMPQRTLDGDDPDRPDVSLHRVLVALQSLRAHVPHRSDPRHSLGVLVEDAAHTKVAQLHDALCSHHNVCRLEVAVNQTVLVVEEVEGSGPAVGVSVLEGVALSWSERRGESLSTAVPSSLPSPPSLSPMLKEDSRAMAGTCSCSGRRVRSPMRKEPEGQVRK